MKVYCKDCRYFKIYDAPRYLYYMEKCEAPTGKIIKDYIHGDYKEKINKSPGYNNYPNNIDTNGCSFYKRKWWKFWIKEENYGVEKSR